MSNELQTYTLEEVAKHNTESSRWIAVNGLVYDVTKFIEHHPGGRKPFEKYSGTDATEKFQNVKQHFENPNIATFMKTLCIGNFS
jgi:cytochrome b involved in lipid metabolism